VARTKFSLVPQPLALSEANEAVSKAADFDLVAVFLPSKGH
jgi:hypothetical protein